MAVTTKITYTGDLRTRAVHLQSSEELITDAPKDNNGLGQAFSPTDLVATGVGSCMLTVMGIKARDLGVKLEGSEVAITKIMASGPRRISALKIQVSLPKNVEDKDRIILERTANTCPVIESIHPEITKEISYLWVL